MVLTFCTVTFLFECIRCLQHSDIALFFFPVNGLWFTVVETGSNVAVVLEVSGSEVDVAAGARVGGTTAACSGSFSDGIVGVSAADRLIVGSEIAAPAGVRVCKTIGKGSVSFSEGAVNRVSWKVGSPAGTEVGWT